MPIPLLVGVALGAQAAIGAGKTITGAIKAKKGRKEAESELNRMGNIKYSDISQGYYNTLANRAQYGLEDDQRRYLEQSSDRAFALGTRAADDRRSGLIGTGAMAGNLAQAYRNIAQMDIQEELRKREMLDQETKFRALTDKEERMGISNARLALNRSNMLEGNRMAQAGLQDMFGAASNLASAELAFGGAGGDQNE